MKFKPKEVMVNLPTVLSFQEEDEIVEMASAFNSFIHGKVKMKYEVLGTLGGQYVGLFYIQRNNESQQLRDEFMAAINAEEEAIHLASQKAPTKSPTKTPKKSAPKDEVDDLDAPDLDGDEYGNYDDNPPARLDRGPFTNCWGTGGRRY